MYRNETWYSVVRLVSWKHISLQNHMTYLQFTKWRLHFSNKSWCHMILQMLSHQRCSRVRLLKGSNKLHIADSKNSHSLEASWYTKELLFALMIRFSWKCFRQKCMPEHHFRAHPLHKIHASMTFFKNAEKIHNSKKKSFSSNTVWGCFKSWSVHFQTKNEAFNFFKYRWCNMIPVK